MSGRHRSAAERAARNAKWAGAGVAGLTAVFAVAPYAHAAPAKPTPSGSKAAPAGAPKPQVAKPKPAADDSSTTTEVPTPNFGEQKIRVGVQIKSGADVPTGTNTGGTVVTIHDTGPGAGLAGNLFGDSCTTVPGSEDPPSTETYCQFLLSDTKRAQLKRALAEAGVSAPHVTQLNRYNDYLQFPGDTVTFTQKTVRKNLVIDSTSQTFEPCVNPINVPGRAGVAAADDLPTCSFDPVEAVFTDPGKPPIARDDARTTGPGEPVTIKVVDNDSLGGAKNITGVKKITDPKHGTAKVVGKPGPATDPAPTIVYTPAAGFAGVDTFKYTLSTANGSSTATVTVTVPAAPSSAPPSSGTGNQNLANTGTDSMALLDLGAVLIVVGASATVVGRRRRLAARHARIG